MASKENTDVQTTIPDRTHQRQFGRFVSIGYLSLVTVIVAWQLGWMFRTSTLYVSPEGSDWYPGTERWPLKKIQTAITRISSGGTVWIEKGTYQERLRIIDSGRLGKPTTIAARIPGTVQITWEMSDGDKQKLDWQFDDGLYITEVPWPIYRVVWNDRQLFRVPRGGVARLRNTVKKPNAFGSFYFEDGKLYVWLPNQVSAPDAQLRLNGNVPEPRDWGVLKSANINISADNVSLAGLNCEFGIGANIMLWDADQVTVSNCLLTGADRGVHAATRSGPSDDLTMDRCFYHNFPQGYWNDDWLKWADIYSGYDNSCLVGVNGERATIRNCVAAHVADGIQITTRDNRVNYQSTVIGCVIAFGTDDAFEFDGPACGITLSDNLVYDCHVGLGMSPVQFGPLVAVRNLFWLHRKQSDFGAFAKLLAPRNWENRTIQNIEISANAFLGNSVCWWHGNSIHNLVATDNFFAYRFPDYIEWPDDSTVAGNTLVDLTQALSTADINALEQRFERWNLGSSVDAFAGDFSKKGVSWLNWNEHPALCDVPLQLKFRPETETESLDNAGK